MIWLKFCCPKRRKQKDSFYKYASVIHIFLCGCWVIQQKCNLNAQDKKDRKYENLWPSLVTLTLHKYLVLCNAKQSPKTINACSRIRNDETQQRSLWNSSQYGQTLCIFNDEIQQRLLWNSLTKFLEFCRRTLLDVS